jgi:hypothetical protein
MESLRNIGSQNKIRVNSRWKKVKHYNVSFLILNTKQSEISKSCNFVMCVKNPIRFFHTMVNKIEEDPNRVFLKHVPLFPGFCFLNLPGLSIRVFHPLPRKIPSFTGP